MVKTPPKQRPLGVAVWGIGAHAVRSVLPAIAESPDIQLAGIHSRNGATLAMQAAAYGCQVWQTPEDMLASPQVDVVYLATPTALHFAHSRQILEQGKHVWCEKPLTPNLADAQTLLDLARARDLSLAVVCGPRYHPHFSAVRAQLDRGVLGQLLSIKAAFRFPHVAPGNFRYNPDLGGGALLDQGFYLLGVIDALAPARLSAIGCRTAVEAGYQVDTSGRVSGTCADGCEVELAWGYGYAYENTLSITGTKGALTTAPFFSKPQNLTPHLTVSAAADAPRSIAVAAANQFVCMLAEFSKGVHDPQKRRQLIDQAGRYQQLLHIAQISARTNAKSMAVA